MPASDHVERRHDREPARPRDGFIVAGVGASAGGLDAFQRFLRHMPPHDRIALVYVQHLDPNHESLLPELLGRQAQLPVQAVRDETPIEPGHVYVIPPNTSLTLKDGLLRLGPRLSEAEFGKPIDGFLASLAEDLADRAVGIVLSGTGSDGTAGLRAIKARGGLTIAQLPESAAYDSMPRSAVAAGVDYILRPDDMPARLVAHASGIGTVAAERPAGTSPGGAIEDALPAICDLVRRKTGHDFACYKRNTLVRRIARRLDALEITSPAEYVQRLERDAGETTHLFQEFLIAVTAFFRDPEAFEALARGVLPSLLEGKGERDQVRVWAIGCSSGEEVYSLAILLAEEVARIGGAGPKVQIFATDIDEEILQVARRGRYPQSACGDISPERLARFFTRDDGEYQVRKELRQMCVFSTHDLLQDPPFPKLDLISCRNLLIYVDGEVQPRVMRLLHHALRSGGFLFLGAAENIAGRPDLFETVEGGQRIFRRRDLTVPLPLDFPLTGPLPRDARGTVPAAIGTGGPEATLRRTVERAVLDEYTPAGMVVREDGDIVYVFGPTAKYLGPSAGAPTLNALALVRKSLRTDLRRALQKAVRAHEPVVVESSLPRADDHAEPVHLLVRPFTGVGSDRGLFVVVFQDVPATASATSAPPVVEKTAVRHLQEELRDTREQVQATIDELEAAAQQLQSANEELLSMNEELQSANEELQSSKEEVQTINGELEAVNRELTRKVEALDTANSDLESLFEGAQVATIFLDNELLIKRFTPTATEVFRLRPGDVGRPVTDITARFIDGDLVPQIREVLRTLQRRELPVTRRDDGTRYLTRILPYRTRENVIDGVVVTFVDVTDLKHAQEALERVNAELEDGAAALVAAGQRKDDFLAMLSHELRNPLAAISSSLHLWKTQNPDDPLLARARELAERQAGQMTRLLNDLLDTARIIRGTIELHREPLDLAEVLRDAVDAVDTGTAKGQQIEVSLPSEPVPVDGDRDRLQQIMDNLLGNARKFTPPNGHIRVSAEAVGTTAVVRVCDDGIGVSPEALPRIFDAFVQGTHRLQGLGLGLALVRHLVELHGGSVEAHSGGEGRGSEFIVRLPLGASAPGTTAASPTAGTDATMRVPSRRILVVDDSPDVAELLALLLRAEGHEVRVASNGPAALQAATDFRPDILLLDLGLPGMDGYEVVRRLRQNKRLASMTVVAVTGYGTDDDRQRTRATGIDHHLVKPVDVAALQALIRDIPVPSE